MTITESDKNYMDQMEIYGYFYERVINAEIAQQQEIHRRQHVPIASRHVVVNGSTVWRVYDGGRK